MRRISVMMRFAVLGRVVVSKTRTSSSMNARDGVQLLDIAVAGNRELINSVGELCRANDNGRRGQPGEGNVAPAPGTPLAKPAPIRAIRTSLRIFSPLCTCHPNSQLVRIVLGTMEWRR